MYNQQIWLDVGLILWDEGEHEENDDDNDDDDNDDDD